jgi:hypothetical protein
MPAGGVGILQESVLHQKFIFTSTCSEDLTCQELLRMAAGRVERSVNVLVECVTLEFSIRYQDLMMNAVYGSQ